MKALTIKDFLYRLFRLNGDDCALVTKHIEERRKISLNERDSYPIPKGTFRGDWKLLIVWGLLAAFIDRPQTLLFILFMPVWIVLILIGRFF